MNLLTNRWSPMSSVLSIEPDGILKAWITKYISSEASSTAENTVSDHSESSPRKYSRLPGLANSERPRQKPTTAAAKAMIRAGMNSLWPMSPEIGMNWERFSIDMTTTIVTEKAAIAQKRACQRPAFSAVLMDSLRLKRALAQVYAPIARPMKKSRSSILIL